MNCLGILFVFTAQSISSDALLEKSISYVFDGIIKELRDTVYDITVINQIDEDESLMFDMKIFSDNDICVNIAKSSSMNVTGLSDNGIIFLKDGLGLQLFYEHLFKKIRFRNFLGKLIYYVYIQNISYEDFVHLKLLHQRFIEFFYFLIEEKASFKLLTVDWYSPKACNKFQLTVVSTYSKQENKWASKRFKIRKFDNFHGCELKVGSKSYNLSTFSSQLQLKVVTDLSRKLNYSMKLCHNTTANIDISISKLVPIQTVAIYGKLSIPPISQPFIFRDSSIAVPVGKEYNGYEKLLMPFENAVWTWIIVTFGIAFLTIFGLKFVSPKVRKFVIGTNTKAPTMNVIKIFFGATQIKSPGRTFARFLAMMFIIYSLIIRTAWQGKMFEFMQKEIRKPEVQSISEMAAKNFTIFIQLNFYINNNYQDLVPQKLRLKMINDKATATSLSEKLFDPNFNGAVQLVHDNLRVQAIESKGKFLKRIFKKRLNAEYLGMEFPGKTGKLSKVFDEKIQDLFQGGFINYYENNYNEYIKPERYKHLHRKGPKVLTLSDLQAGFVIWLGSVLVAVIVFICELIHARYWHLWWKNAHI